MTTMIVFGSITVYFALGLRVGRKEYTRQYKYVQNVREVTQDYLFPGMWAMYAVVVWPFFCIRYFFQGELIQEAKALQKLNEERNYWKLVTQSKTASVAEKEFAQETLMRLNAK